jgi:hypothetical protein
LAAALVSLAFFVFIESFSSIKMPHRRRDDYTPLGIYWLFLADAHATSERGASERGASERGASEREMWQRLRAPRALRSDALTVRN